MIISAAFVPSAPILVPVVAQGAAYELDDLRRACVRVVADATVSAVRVVIVGAGTTTRTVTAGTGTFRGFGVDLDVDLDPATHDATWLPLSLSVGAWLLAEAGWAGPRAALEVDTASSDSALDEMGAGLAHGDEPVALVVVADGSNGRTEKAPGYLVPDAEPFDADVAKLLATGDPTALAGIDRERALTVGAAGYPAWRTASAALAGSAYDAELVADVAPYGVGYLVALWRR